MAKEMHENYLIMGLLVVGLVVVSILALMQDGSQKETIDVSGDSELSVEPDKAEVLVQVLTINESASAARDKNSQVTNNVKQALDGMDVEIETESYRLHRREDYNPETGKSEFRGYELSNVLKVTTTDLENVGNVIDTAVNNGANGIQRVTFDLTEGKQKEVQEEAMRMAAENAAQKAQDLAGTLNVELGRLSSISESSFDYRPVYAEAEQAKDTTISPGEVSVNARVSLSYNIRQ